MSEDQYVTHEVLRKGKRGRPRMTDEQKALAKQRRDAGLSPADRPSSLPAPRFQVDALPEEKKRCLLLHHIGTVARHDREIARLRDEQRSAVRLAKSEIGTSFENDMALYQKLETVEGKKLFKAQVERGLLIARYAGVPVPEQIDMFDRGAQETIEHKTFEAGQRAAMIGTMAVAPAHLSEALKVTWLAGHEAGIAITEDLMREARPTQVGHGDHQHQITHEDHHHV